MTTATIAGYLNKKEIEANYGRSYRSLTRDITRAVKSRDSEVLEHLKLVTDDDQIREGIDVTFDLIQELSNNGLRPMWVAEEMWVAEWCAKKLTHTEKDQESTRVQPDPQPVVPSTNVDSPAIVQMLHQRNIDLAKQNELLVDQLKIKDDQIRAANKQAEQNQQLMRDLHVLLKDVQDGLLGEGTTPRIAPPSKSRGESPQTVTVQAGSKPTTSRPVIKSSPKKKTAKRIPPKPVAQSVPPTLMQRIFPTFTRANKSRNK